MTVRRGLALVGLLLAGALQSPAAWAGASSFDDRFATFPKIDSVRDVDWYDPLEVAKGRPGAPLSQAAEGQRSITPDALKAAIDYVDARGTVALLVWQGGKLQLAHYGPGSDPTTLTDTASMHKSVVGILYGAAIRDGAIKSIDEPAADYLPEWAHDDRAKITIHNLLNMASGLDDQFVGFNKSAPTTQLLLSTDIVPVALSRPVAAPPNTIFDYNNNNVEVLGAILQRATGMRYADYLSRTLLKPIGAGDGRVWLDRPGGMAHTFCCLQLTAEDWLRIGLLLKDQGRVLDHKVIPAAWIKQMTVPSNQNPNYGLLIWLANPYLAERGYKRDAPQKIPAREPFLAKDMFFFDGWGAQRVYVSRAADLVIVRVGNATQDWDDSYVPNVIMRGLGRQPAP